MQSLNVIATEVINKESMFSIINTKFLFHYGLFENYLLFNQSDI